MDINGLQNRMYISSHIFIEFVIRICDCAMTAFSMLTALDVILYIYTHIKMSTSVCIDIFSIAGFV